MFPGQWSVVHQRPNVGSVGQRSGKFIFVDNFDLSSSCYWARPALRDSYSAVMGLGT